MNYARALFGFASYSDPKLLTDTNIVIGFMTNNQHFQNPSPSLGEVDAFYKKFQQKYEAAKSGDRVKIAEKSIARQELIAIMRELCNYVNMASQNDRAVLLSSGFKISKETLEPQVLGSLRYISVETGLNKNEIKVSCETVKNAVSYIFMCADAEPTSSTIWSNINVTTSQTIFKNLTKGVEYFFRVEVVGRNNQRRLSDINSYICQ